MSNAYVKKYETHHTKERQKGPPDTPRKPRSAYNRPKPFKIETRWTYVDPEASWTTYNRYRTKEARDRALAQLLRKYKDRCTIQFR